jgi:hypothetical protein
MEAGFLFNKEIFEFYGELRMLSKLHMVRNYLTKLNLGIVTKFKK